MSFTDDLKRSLGFEETDSNRNGPSIIDSIRDALKPKENPNMQRSNSQQQYGANTQYPYGQSQRPVQSPTPRPQPKPTSYYDDFDDYVIVPEHSYYELILIRPKTIDDVNYVVDQVIEEQNPVIVDLSFLERESAPNYKLAGDKIKQMKSQYGVQVLLLARMEDKNLIIISPKKVKVINKK